jgi:hypothetical protein
LLDFGLNKDTADCFLEYMGIDNYGNNVWHSSIIVNNYRIPDYSRDIPAWSLHRLIVLSKIGIMESSVDNIYDKVIQYIEYIIKCGNFNKEYLKQ